MDEERHTSMRLFLIVLCLKTICFQVEAQTPYAEANFTHILNVILNESLYDGRVPPDSISGEPTVMDVGVYVLEMHSVSDDNMVRILSNFELFVSCVATVTRLLY